jgi:predicted nucleic acid-binding protein
MNAVFADTSFWIALLSPRDACHAEAAEIGRTLVCPVVTTEYVLLEVANFFSKAEDKPLFLQCLSLVRTQSRFVVLPMTAAWLASGLESYGLHGDKDWSLTDCISFQVMKEQGIRDALATDHHFAQAGFRILLKGP